MMCARPNDSKGNYHKPKSVIAEMRADNIPASYHGNQLPPTFNVVAKLKVTSTWFEFKRMEVAANLCCTSLYISLLLPRSVRTLEYILYRAEHRRRVVASPRRDSLLILFPGARSRSCSSRLLLTATDLQTRQSHLSYRIASPQSTPLTPLIFLMTLPYLICSSDCVRIVFNVLFVAGGARTALKVLPPGLLHSRSPVRPVSRSRFSAPARRPGAILLSFLSLWKLFLRLLAFRVRAPFSQLPQPHPSCRRTRASLLGHPLHPLHCRPGSVLPHLG